MAGEGFALEKFNQAAVGIPAPERSVKGKDFPKRGKFFPIGTSRDGEGFALDILTPRQARCGFFATRRQDPVVAPELAVASELRVDRVKPPRWGPNGVFRMGVAGWRLAHTKRIVIGRATVVAVLEDWHLICSVVVAAGSMIMIGITLYDHLQQ